MAELAGLQGGAAAFSHRYLGRPADRQGNATEQGSGAGGRTGHSRVEFVNGRNNGASCGEFFFPLHPRASLSGWSRDGREWGISVTLSCYGVGQTSNAFCTDAVYIECCAGSSLAECTSSQMQLHNMLC